MSQRPKAIDSLELELQTILSHPLDSSAGDQTRVLMENSMQTLHSYPLSYLSRTVSDLDLMLPFFKFRMQWHLPLAAFSTASLTTTCSLK